MKELPVADTLQLQQLIGRCMLALDFGDAEGYAQCFAADGEVHLEEVLDQGFHETVYEGYAKLREHVTTLFAVTAGHVRHFNTNAVIDRSADGNAQAVSYVLVVKAGKFMDAALISTGIIRDNFVQVDGEWKIRRRTFHVDPQPEHARQHFNKITWMKDMRDAMLAKQQAGQRKNLLTQ